MIALPSFLRTGLAALLLALCAVVPASADLLSPADRQAYRAAFVAAHAHDWDAARRLAAGARERLPAKLLLWLELQSSDAASLADLAQFIDGNPDWPSLGQLRQRAEQASLTAPDGAALAYLAAHRPATLRGHLRLADLLAASGDAAGCDAVVRALWIGGDLSVEDENLVLERHAASLGPAEHAARLDRLLWDGQAAAARRLLPLVPQEQRLLAEARLALAAQLPDAEQVLEGVPAGRQRDPGLVLDHIRWARKRDQLDDAVRLLRDPPPALGRPAAWWAERDLLVRRLIDGGKPSLAYDLAGWHGLGESGAELADAEFLAGWVALRRLDDPKAAYAHFTRLYAGVKRPISLARGAYWAGRAAEALGDGENAQHWYATAAIQGTTYYGALAAARLGTAVTPDFPPLPQPSDEERQAFAGREGVRAAQLLGELGEPDLARLFLAQLNGAARSPAEWGQIATLADQLGVLDIGIAAARLAGRDGIPALGPGYPVLPVEIRGPAEPPLVLAIIRQESAFDRGAVSRSDARGLMQLKPGTAKEIAATLSLPFAATRLTADAAYNITLGQVYLDRLVASFGGSYVLGIAAYNGGPGRIKQWLNAYGDPRNPDVDVVDWIESIPFQETRNYVQRVLENLQIYRYRLGRQSSAFTLASDLKR